MFDVPRFVKMIFFKFFEETPFFIFFSEDKFLNAYVLFLKIENCCESVHSFLCSSIIRKSLNHFNDHVICDDTIFFCKSI